MAWYDGIIRFFGGGLSLSALVSALGGTVERFYAETRLGGINRRFLIQPLLGNELDVTGDGVADLRVQFTPSLPLGATLRIEPVGPSPQGLTITVFIALDNDVFPVGNDPATIDYLYLTVASGPAQSFPTYVEVAFEQQVVSANKVQSVRLGVGGAASPLALRFGLMTSPVTVRPAVQSLTVRNPVTGDLISYTETPVNVRTGDPAAATSLIDADLTMRSPTGGILALAPPLTVTVTTPATGLGRLEVAYTAPSMLGLSAHMTTRDGNGTGLLQAAAESVPRAVTVTSVDTPSPGTPRLLYSAPPAVLPALRVFSETRANGPPTQYRRIDALVEDLPPIVRLFLTPAETRLETQAAVGGDGVIGRIRVEYSPSETAPVPSIGVQGVHVNLESGVVVADVGALVGAEQRAQPNPAGGAQLTVIRYRSTQRRRLAALVRVDSELDLVAELEFLPNDLMLTTDGRRFAELDGTDGIDLVTVNVGQWTQHSSGARQRVQTTILVEGLPPRARLVGQIPSYLQWSSPGGRTRRVLIRRVAEEPDWAGSGMSPPAVPVPRSTIEVDARGFPTTFTAGEISSLDPRIRIVNYQASEAWDEIRARLEEATARGHQVRHRASDRPATRPTGNMVAHGSAPRAVPATRSHQPYRAPRRHRPAERRSRRCSTATGAARGRRYRGT